MRLVNVHGLRCVSAVAVLALLASAAAAFPLSAAVEQLHSNAAPNSAMKHEFAILRSGRLASDHTAALESAQIALSRVPDGSTYVWHRPSGRLSGSIKPTRSFRRVNGELCRHIVMELSTREMVRAVEGIACRDLTGVWRLEG